MACRALPAEPGDRGIERGLPRPSLRCRDVPPLPVASAGEWGVLLASGRCKFPGETRSTVEPRTRFYREAYASRSPEETTLKSSWRRPLAA
jgi:hypothetical protein